MSANAKQILGEVVEQQRMASMPDLSLPDYFEIFSAEQVTKDYTLSFDELEAAVVDGEHDGGVDSVFVIVNGDLIKEDSDLGHYKKNVQIDLVIVQSKSTGGFTEDPINRLIASLSELLELDADYLSLTQYNLAVKSAFDVFRQAYRKLASRFPVLNISVNYAALNADSEIHANLVKKSDQLKVKLNALFDEAQVSFCFLGAKELLALARQKPNETFDLIFSKSLTSENGYVVLAQLNEYNDFLRNGEAGVRQDLFESNVRDYQGTTEVNTDISESLNNNTDVDFWWLNNGVTVLGSRATVTGSRITIENPQIVNGLQTSSQIAKYYDEGGNDTTRLIMVKIVSSEDEAVRDQIIKATNSQNAVPRASLRATDKVQRDIEHALAAGNYFYDRRKNYYKNQGKPASRIIGIPLLAQAMMTLLRGEPDNARARPSSLIKEDDVYSVLFSEDYPVDSFLVAADLTRRIENTLKHRNEFTATDRNNLRFYCLWWIAVWAAKSTKLSAVKISGLKNKIADEEIEEGITLVAAVFKEKGGSDKVAKGPDFKKDLAGEISTRILAHFKG